MAKRANGEGSIRQRGDRWEARVTVGYGPDGRQSRKTLYGDTRAEVQHQMTKALRELHQGVPLVDERQTVKQFLTRWLEENVKPNVRPSTYRRSEQAVRLHLIPKLGRIRLANLSPQDVQTLLRDKLAEGLSGRSVQIIHAVLRAALNDGLRLGDVQRNVASLVRPPRSTPKTIRPFSPEEARQFLKAIDGDRLEALFVLALSSGLRQAELLGLRWQDLDLDAASLSVRYALEKRDGEYGLVEPKTSKSRRTIAITAMAVAALRAHRVRQAEERLSVGPGWTGLDLVFTTKKGQPLCGNVVCARFKRILARAGLPAQRFHDLRHCCATLLLTQGVHPRLVMEALGHSAIGVTMNTYSHVLTELKRETAVQMDALFSAAGPTGT
jgi:integrase